jgi:hypothetical protein
MESYIVGPGIRFNDFIFSEPVPWNSWTPPKFAGLFVLLVADTSWAPRPFQPLYFGEFGNNARNPLAVGSNRLPAGAGSLFLSVLPLPFSSSAQRSEARNQLIWAYNPVYQASVASTHDELLVRKLDELEKKHEEQSTQFQLLLSHLNRLFEPLPEPARHPIGFLPQTAE